MLPDLEKILEADHQAQAAVRQAQEEAEKTLEEAMARVRDLEAHLEEELAGLREKTEADIMGRAQEKADRIRAAAAGQVQELTDRQAALKEEAVVYLVAEVLGG